MSANRTWPPKPDGTPDWEVMFEDEKTGLIPLIAQAHAPEALRQSVTAVIQGLFTRKNDRSSIKKFTAELNRILADYTHPTDINALHDRVTTLLRRIKEDRKRTGAKAARKKMGKDGERRLAVAKRKPVYSSWVWLSAFGAVAVCGVGFLVVWSNLEEDTPAFTRLVEEMEFAAQGGALSSHVFGGALKVEAEGKIIAVTADSVPRSACVNAAWILGGTGKVAINGMMPTRLIATQLADLCGRVETGATITWFPEN